MAMTQDGRCGDCKFWLLYPNQNRHGNSNSPNWCECLKEKILRPKDKDIYNPHLTMRFDFCDEFENYEEE